MGLNSIAAAPNGPGAHNFRPTITPYEPPTQAPDPPELRLSQRPNEVGLGAIGLRIYNGYLCNIAVNTHPKFAKLRE